MTTIHITLTTDSERLIANGDLRLFKELLEVMKTQQSDIPPQVDSQAAPIDYSIRATYTHEASNETD